MKPASYTIVDGLVSGRHADIPVRDYLPKQRRAERPMLWIHGGGWYAGSLDGWESDAPARAWAVAGRWVRTIDYRLAPKVNLFRDSPLKAGPNRFPAGLHDVVDVMESMHAESSMQIVVGGASAGANLAAMATLQLRDQAKPLPSRLALAYGAYHGVLPDASPAYLSLRGPLARWAFNPKMYRRMVDNYVGEEEPAGIARAFPSGADLGGFPPSLLLHAGNDRLHATGLLFGQELRDAAVEVQEETVRAMHGFLALPKRAAFTRGVALIGDWMKQVA